MRIGLIGDFSEARDEGYRNACHSLASELSKRHEVMRLNAKQAGRRTFWTALGRCHADVIHIVAQPTWQSLLLVCWLRRHGARARLVLSALRPERFFANGRSGWTQKLLLRLARLDLVLVQSPAAAQRFAEAGCPVAALPNGVDLERFRPATRDKKRCLRRQYGQDLERPLALHVGHVRLERNLTALGPLCRAGMQVVVVGSLCMGVDPVLTDSLERLGLLLRQRYEPHVEDFYRLADCYVFPTRPGNSLAMPLSVLEAMACNLPVVTTRFEGLQHAFQEANGLRYIDHADELLPAVQETIKSGVAVRTRDMVQGYSWQTVVGRLECHYRRLLAQ